MSLKCNICREEYSYGRKIVFHCEHEHIQFGAIFENERKSHAWNCNYTEKSYISQDLKPIFEYNILELEKNRESFAIVFE